MQLLINSEEDLEVDEETLNLIRKALEAVLKQEGLREDVEVSLLLVNNQKMTELNKRYRGIDDTTDVLSFPMLEGSAGNLQFPDEEEILLGDIVISVPRAGEQAANYGHTFTEEMTFLAIHGMLHLLGHDHAAPEETDKMRAAEAQALAACGIVRP